MLHLKSNKIVRSKGKKLSELKIQKDSQNKINKNIRNLFKLKKQKSLEEKSIGDIKKSFEQEGDYLTSNGR